MKWKFFKNLKYWLGQGRLTLKYIFYTLSNSFVLRAEDLKKTKVGSSKSYKLLRVFCHCNKSTF